MANKVPKPLIKQIENFDSIIEALNGLIDGSKIKLENYDEDFLEDLSDIRKKGLELRDQIEVFKSKLESSVVDEYATTTNSRFASTKGVIDNFLTKTKEQWV